MTKIVLLVCFVGLSITAFCQVQTIGFQSGFNISKLSADYYFTNSKSRVGFVGGLKYEYAHNRLILGADALYNQMGFVEKTTFTDESGNIKLEDFESKFNYDYLSVPLKLGYSFGNKLRIVPMLGIQPSFLLRAKTTGLINNAEQSMRSEVFDVKDHVTKFDCAGLVELELDFALMPNIDVFASCSGKYSLTKFSNSDYFPEGNMKHHAFAFSLGLKYTLKAQ